MLFKKKASTTSLPSVRVCSSDQVLYENLLKDIPIKENILIEKSIAFFNDPAPCFIHRSAVQVRLTEELHQELLARNTETPGPLFTAYVDLDNIKSCRLL